MNMYNGDSKTNEVSKAGVNFNKGLFKEMLNADPRWLSIAFDYQVHRIQFNLSGVRDWLAEQEEKALAKKAKDPKAKKGNLEEARAALASTKEANAASRVEATAAAAQTKANLDEKERRFKEKVAALEQKNVLAGTWKRDGGLVIEIPTIDNWSEEGGYARIIKRSQSWSNDYQPEVKFKNISYIKSGVYDCIDFISTYNKEGKWVKCQIKVADSNKMLFSAENGFRAEYSRVK